MREDPQLATAVGERRYNGVWEDYSISVVETKRRDLSEWLRLFDQIDPKTLDDEGRLNRDLMLRHLKEQLTSLRWKTYEMPINPHSGVLKTVGPLSGQYAGERKDTIAQYHS